MAVVKVQMPIASTIADPPAVIYAQGGAHAQLMPITIALRERMNGEFKAFFHAELVAGKWQLGERAPWQEW